MRKRPSSRSPITAWWLICSTRCRSWQPNWSAPDMNVDVKPAAGMAPMVTEPPEINTVGVIGAGQMGNGIAHVCALAGLPVTIVDIKQDALAKAMTIMARNMERQVNRSIITPDQRDEALARVKTSNDYAVFADADLVIEAATEKEDLKRLIFKSLIPHL